MLRNLHLNLFLFSFLFFFLFSYFFFLSDRVLRKKQEQIFVPICVREIQRLQLFQVWVDHRGVCCE